MTDKIHEKVVDLFTRHKKQLPITDDEKVIRNEDGFFYVCIKNDENGIPFDKERVLSKVSGIHYIIKVLVASEPSHMYNYQVPADRILEFLTPYINNEKDGEIIEIDRYYPHDLA